MNPYRARQPYQAGGGANIPIGSVITAAGFVFKNSIDAGDSLEVPAGYSMIVGPDYAVLGDLIVLGDTICL